MPANKRYAEFRAKGLCGQCGAPSPDKSKCDACNAQYRAKRVAREAERKAKGICVSCSAPAKPGCVVCEKCSAVASGHATKRYHSNKAAGVCRNCGNPSDGKSKCATCTELASKSHRKMYEDRKAAGLCCFCAKPAIKGQVYCRPCGDIHNQRELRYRSQTRKEVLNHYGSNCACCGRPDMGVHEIDHINGGGTKHIKQLKSGSAFYRWLKKQGFPEGFQTLCPTCNKLKHKFGACPCKNSS
jgi:hypothetical protein